MTRKSKNNKSKLPPQAELFYLLCPPGEGVYKNHRCERFRRGIAKSYFKTENFLQAEQAWKSFLEQEIESFLQGKLIFFTVPFDGGAGVQRGASLGPIVARYFLKEFLLKNKNWLIDLGDIKVIPYLIKDEYVSDKIIKGVKKFLYKDEGINLPIASLDMTERLLKNIKTIVSKPVSFLVFGGDHSISYSLIKEWFWQRKDRKTAIIIFDAHSDLASSRSGFEITYSSWVSHLLEKLNNPAIFQIGLRESSFLEQEKKLGKAKKIKQFWMENNWERSKMKKIEREILTHIIKNNIEEIYLSIDLDVLDGSFGSAVETPSFKEGLSPRQIVGMVEKISQSAKVTGVDLVELAPFVSNLAFQKEDIQSKEIKIEDFVLDGQAPAQSLSSALYLFKNLARMMKKAI